MKCAMVILNYNDGKRATELADTCSKFAAIEKIVIVDNKSTDNSVNYFQEINNSKIDLVFAKDNRGFARGNNIGAKFLVEKYSPNYILFANTDTIFNENDIYACLEILTSNKNIGLVSMRIKDINGNEERAAWNFKPYWKYLLFNFWIYRRFTYKNDQCFYNDESKVEFVDMVRGSFMLFSAKALINADYFDEGTFLYYEEECISCRLKQHGYQVAIATNHFYIHNHITLPNSNHKKNKKVMNESLIYFLNAYYNIGKLKTMIFKMAIRISDIETALIEKVKHR